MGKRILTENDIDQSYDPTSSNTQSGKALAPIFQKKLEIWKPNTEYVQGDVVFAKNKYADEPYDVIMKCIRNHKSPNLNYPNEDMESFECWEVYESSASLANVAKYDDEGNYIPDTYATKKEVGDIETALDNIIAIQNSLIGGGSV